MGVGLVRHVAGDVGGIGRRVQERVVELGLQFGMEGAFPENGLRRLLYELVLPIGEHVVRRGDRRKQQQDAVVEGVAGIGWMGWGSMDSMEAEVGREDMGRLLCWSVNGRTFCT